MDWEETFEAKCGLAFFFFFLNLAVEKLFLQDSDALWES